MRIMVISDTHGSIDTILGEVDRIEPDYMIHLGDNFPDAQDIADISGIDISYVRGNCDMFTIGDVHEEEILEFDDIKIFIAHGHTYNTKMTSDLVYERALNLDADIALFGHSHFQEIIKRKKVTLMNPGSPDYPRGGSEPGYGLIDIVDNDFKMKLIQL